MAKLILRDKFKIEVPKQDGTYDIIEGSLRTITKQEQIKLEADFKEATDLSKELAKKTNKLQKLAKKIDRLDSAQNADIEEISKLEESAEELENEINEKIEKLNSLDTENKALSFKMNMLLDEESKASILNLANTYGFKLVWNTIQEGINEGK